MKYRSILTSYPLSLSFRSKYQAVYVILSLYFPPCHSAPQNAHTRGARHSLDENKWHVGFGLMGEQGAESIHAYFNSLTRTYHSVPDGVERLRCMMREHYLHSAPSLVTVAPAIKKKKTEQSNH